MTHTLEESKSIHNVENTINTTYYMKEYASLQLSLDAILYGKTKHSLWNLHLCTLLHVWERWFMCGDGKNSYREKGESGATTAVNIAAKFYKY